MEIPIDDGDGTGAGLMTDRTPALDSAVATGNAAVVIPTFNERDNIPKLIAALLGLYPDIHILVVDDHSPDGTSAAVRELQQSHGKLMLLERMRNPGFANSYRDGFRHVLAGTLVPGGDHHGRGFLARPRGDRPSAGHTGRPRCGPGLALYRGRQRAELELAPAAAEPGREFLCPHRAGPVRPRRDRRVSYACAARPSKGCPSRRPLPTGTPSWWS